MTQVVNAIQRWPQYDPSGHLKTSCEELDGLKLTSMVKFMSRTMDQLYELAEPQGRVLHDCAGH